MLKYSLKRLASSLITLCIIITVVFVLLRQMPIEGYFDNYDKLDENIIEAKLEKMGLNDPMIVQYVRYMKNILTGDWGVSMHNQKPVFENIFARWEPTILLTIYSTTLAVVIGIPVGVISARKRNSVLDYTVTTLSSVGMSGVPGGGYIGEYIICSIFFPDQMELAFPILVTIGNLVDPPATMVNAAGDYVASFIVSRYVDGKEWLTKALEKKKAAKA